MISDVAIALRLALAALLGSLIGFEREGLFWAAGISFDVDRLKKLLHVRASQIRRVTVSNEEDGVQGAKVQLVRVSARDIRVGLERLKANVAVYEVELTQRERRAARGPN